jgi:hypothetical protein
METPPFLLWSLEHICPIRGLEDGSDPERTERQLRAAREFDRARAEGRIFEGLALDPPLGFRIAETLAIYGGVSAIAAACNNCPCNALGQDAAGKSELAGCYGIVPLPQQPEEFYGAVDRAWTDALPLPSSTTPRWFGLWQHSPMAAEHLESIATILRNTVTSDATCQAGISSLVLGLNAARHTPAPLHVRLYPSGRVDGLWWRLVPHCPNCTAAWNRAARGKAGRCDVCGYSGFPAPDHKRHARGKRPYFPLSRLLGADQAADLVRRLAARGAL